MINRPSHTNPRVQLLQDVFESATRDASIAMCRWTNGRIALTLDEVCEMPLEDVGTQLDFGFDLMTMVVLTFEGEIGGTMEEVDLIVVFDRARRVR